LITLIRRYLDHPDADSEVWARIAGDWDYRNPEYVSRFMSLIPDMPAAP